MLDVDVDLVRCERLVAPAVADHVDRPGVEVLTMREQIAHIGLGMTAGAMEQDERRLAACAAAQITRADPARLEIALLEAAGAELDPDAAMRMLGHSPAMKRSR